MVLNNKKKKITIIVCVSLIVILAIVGIALLLLNGNNGNPTKENITTGISVYINPNKLEYYIGQEFDPEGIKLQVTNKNNEYTYIVDDLNEMTFSGFDSSVANEALSVTVSYQGYSTTFNVVIKEYENPQPTLESIEVCDLQTTYSVERWNKNGPNLYGSYLKLTYSDGSTKGSYEETPLLWDYVEPLSKVDGAGTTQMVINYIEGGVVVSTTVIITITD